MIPAFFSSARMILLECHESPALGHDKILYIQCIHVLVCTFKGWLEPIGSDFQYLIVASWIFNDRQSLVEYVVPNNIQFQQFVYNIDTTNLAGVGMSIQQSIFFQNHVVWDHVFFLPMIGVFDTNYTQLLLTTLWCFGSTLTTITSFFKVWSYQC
jgi:hypothetical protein